MAFAGVEVAEIDGVAMEVIFFRASVEGISSFDMQYPVGAQANPQQPTIFEAIITGTLLAAAPFSDQVSKVHA